MYRDKIKDLLLFKNKKFIKVITGIRRCGKSTLLKLYSQELNKNKDNNIIYINFEEFKYQYITNKELYEILKKEIKPNTYLLLDEIQRVKKWELVINSLFAEYEDIDIYITGSNAYLLSSELSTYLAGRYVEIKLYPFSFKEFLEFHKLEKNNHSFNAYIKYGGMPSLSNNFIQTIIDLKMEKDKDGIYDIVFENGDLALEYGEIKIKNETIINSILDGICSSIIIKDILEQVQIKEVKTLKRIILFLSDNIGNITSLNKIKNTLKSETKGENTHIKTIESYITALQNAFLFYEVERYDIKGKEYLQSLNKYYIADIGLRNHLLGKNTDRGRILENIVFLELIRRGYKVYIGKINNLEIDFIAEKNNEKIYFQVTETMMGEETRNRELRSLKEIRDNYEKIVLSMDEIFLENEEGIKHKNIINWLVE